MIAHQTTFFSFFAASITLGGGAGKATAESENKAIARSRIADFTASSGLKVVTPKVF